MSGTGSTRFVPATSRLYLSMMRLVMPHSLILNGVPVFCRFLTIHKSPSKRRSLDVLRIAVWHRHSCLLFVRRGIPKWERNGQARRYEGAPAVSALQGCAFLRSEQPRHIRFFEGEEPYLPLDAARIARQAAVAPHDPMAGNDDADGIVSDSAAYGLCRDGFRALPAGDFTGDLSVGDRLPEGICRRISHTASRNGEPCRCRGGVGPGSFPPK